MSGATNIFATPKPPHADELGVVLPDGTRVTLADEQRDASWKRTSHFGHTEEVRSFAPVLGAPTFSSRQEEESLRQLRGSRSDQEVALYGGFIIEHFYLTQLPIASERAEIGARLASLLIRFWEERLSQEDARARDALPMLRRSFWRSLVVLAHQANILLPPDRPPEAIVLQALAEQLGIVPSTFYLSGWVEQLPAVYQRALTEWRAVCLDDRPAPFFMEQLCAWEGLSKGRWQMVREREVDGMVWDGRVLRDWLKGLPYLHDSSLGKALERSGPLKPFLFKQSLRLPGVETYTGRSDLRRLVTSWYQPRYALWTAGRVRWRIGRAEGEPTVWMAIRWWTMGAVRLWAGAAVAYIATMLQGDTWRTLIDLSIHRSMRGCWIAIGLSGCIALFLAYGVWRRSGVFILGRTALLMLKGESFALAAGALAIYFLAPSVLGEVFPTEGWLLAVILYAQLALFIGVFTLLLDDKSLTAPLNEP